MSGTTPAQSINRSGWRRLAGIAAPARALTALAIGVAVLATADDALARFGSQTSPDALMAGPINGGFEADLANWLAVGNVQALQDTNFSPLVTPTEGGKMALLCNGPGSQSRTYVPANLDQDPGDNDDNDRSALSQTFTLQPGDVPATLSFDWSFITAEGVSDPSSFDDFFQVTLNGPDGGRLLAGSAPNGGVSPYPDVSTDAVHYVVTSPAGASSTNGCSFQNGRSPFEKFLSIIETPGTYTLEFLVSDQGDNDFVIDSGLIIDNVQLTPVIDLVVTKTANPNPAIAGAPLFYDLTIRNDGTGNAQNVVVTDTLPAGVVLVDDTNVPPCVEAPAGVITCSLGDMSGGTQKTFQIKVVVDGDARAGGVTILENFAHVEADNPDRDPTNNDFTLRTVLQDEADLRLQKVSQPDLQVAARDPFTYTLFVDNLGPSYARNLHLQDDILASGDFTLIAIHDDPDRDDTCTPSAEGFDCLLNDPLEPEGLAPLNGRWTIEVEVRAETAQDVSNLARVFSEDPDGVAGPDEATPDPDMSNNAVRDFISIFTTADITLTKIGEDLADGDLQVLAGGAVRWTLVARNRGPSRAVNVTVVDTLPPGLVEGSIEANITTPAGGGICTTGTPGDPSDPTVCQAGNLEPGQAATIVIMADVDPSFLIGRPNTPFSDYLANDAYVTSDTPELNSLNNRVTDAFLEVLGEADLAVVKADQPDPVVAGTSLSYGVQVSNAGPSTAESVVVDDDLPPGVTFLTADVLGGAGSCVYLPGLHRVRCNLGHILPEQVIQIAIVVGVDSDVADGAVLSNTARRNGVLTVTADPNPANDSATTTTAVVAVADLSIVKTGTPVKVGAGEQVKYTIDLANLGPSDAQDVVVYDVLPDEVTYEVDTNTPMCTQPSALIGFRAELAGANEVPPAATDATGLATFVLDTATNELVYAVEVADLPDATMAHIHQGAAGVNGPVVQFLYAGAPPAFNPPNPIVGHIQLTPAEQASLIGNPAGFYVNVHSPSFPGGEIRGQLAQTLQTPLRCEIGTMSASGDPRWPTEHTFDIWGLVDPATPAGSLITNVAIAVSPNEPTAALPAPNGTGRIVLSGHNSMDSFSNYIEGFVDLKITKFGKRDAQVRAGEILTYTVVVDNLGPSSATAVAVKDILQSSGVFDLIDIATDRDAFCRGLPGPTPGVTITATAWPPTTPPPPFGVLAPTGVAGINQRLEVDCTLVDGLSVLEADGPPNSGRWILTMRVRAAQPQDVNNIADVVSETSETDVSNNHAEVEHEVTAVADLEVEKTAVGEMVFDGCPPGISLVPDQVTAGLGVTYTMTVTNNGPSRSENTVLLDRLPPGIVVTGATVVAGSGTCSTGAPGSPHDRLTCGLGTLELGETRVIQVTADVLPSVPDGTILENDVRVYSDRFDPTNTNDYDANLTTVSALADLSITKTDQPDPVVAGELLEYTIVVNNAGPSDALGVVVTDTLPAAVEFVRIRDPFGHGIACSLNPIDEHTLTCDLPNIPDGGSVAFTVVVLVNPNAPPTLDNQVVVAAATDDPCAANNATDEQTGVDREDQLYISKDDSPDPVLAGTEVTYHVIFGNSGPSTATNVRVTDTLPVGMVFDRCESLDINDQVTCTVLSGDGDTTSQIVLVEEILDDNVVVYQDGGTMDPGEEFDFLLIADVQSGYVLDGRGDTGPGQACESFFLATGYPHYAHNRVDFTSDQDTDRDDECTRVNSLADIEVDLAIAPPGGGAVFFGGADQPDRSSAPASLALPLQTAEECSPISPGEELTWRATVRNLGPSDAADVLFEAQLPPGVVHDPDVVTVEVDGDLVDTPLITIRDDGYITVQLCRLNFAGVVTIDITTRVREDASGPQPLAVEVSTIVDDRCPDRPGRPTPDPVLENNVAVREILVMSATIEVRKTVSFNGVCPGLAGRVTAQTGQRVTYCLEITNTGDTYLDDITVLDTISTRLGTRTVFTDVITSGADEFVPVAPGETVLRQYTINPLLGEECGTAVNSVEVSATPTNSGRTVFDCVLPASATDSVRVDVPCAGVDFRLQLPALDNDECETWIQVQNVGERETKALLVIWGEAGFCPPQAAGPLKVECSGLLRPGSAWSFAPGLLPTGAKSAIAYSMNATDLIPSIRGNLRPFADVACDTLFDEVVGSHELWAEFDLAYRRQDVFRSNPNVVGEQTILDFGAHPGEPLAITVNRQCPDPTDPNVTVNAAYTGVSSDEEGARDPIFGGFTYYAPLIVANQGGLDTWLWIHNSGDECTSLEIWFKAQDNCLRPILGDVLSLAPGESIHFDPNTVVGPDWQGSAWIRGSQPLGIVVDIMGSNHFSSYKAVTGDIDSLDFSLGTQVNYAPLIYNQQQGWDTLIQVQNLSSTTAAKVKVYYLDRSGGIVQTLVDWICPRGSQTFFLPVIGGIPGNWVGSARVESQEWWSPGDPLVDPPRIQSVVLLEKWDDPARSIRREAMAYNAFTERTLLDWQLGRGDGTDGSAVLAVPLLAKDNRGINSELAITNLVPKPGFTDFVIFLYDQNGLIDRICEKLNEKQVEYIDLSQWGAIAPRWLGSAVISATFWEHDVFDGQGRFVRNYVGLGAVAVERIGGAMSDGDIPGDESKAYEAFPVWDFFLNEGAVSCP